jgi:universal stress protein E
MKEFQKILVVVDSSQSEQIALKRALELADQTGAKLHLVDLVKDVSLTFRLLSRDYTHIHTLLVQEKQVGVQKLVDLCKAHGVEATGEVLEGISSQLTIDAARRFEADLIIRGAKGAHSLETGSLGASAQKLLRNLPCSVWLAQAEHEVECKSIVAAVDASPDDAAHAKLSRRILQIGQQLAVRERGKLHVCYVWGLYGSEMLKHRLPESEYEMLVAHNRKQHTESFEKLLSEFELHATSPNAHILEGEPSSVIPTLCEEQQADLLICGTVARHGISGLLLGNTAERIIRRVDCSILAVTPPR